MTVLLVFQAVDGLLVLADGRRTRTNEDLERVVLEDMARKSVIVPGGNAVAMAAGWTKFGEQFAADVFGAALRVACLADEQRTVYRAAEICLQALKVATDGHPVEHRIVWVVVAGFDASRAEPQVYEGVAAVGGSQGPELIPMRDHSIYALPMHLSESIGHLVRERFGYFTPDEYERRINLPLGHPDQEALHGERYALDGKDLEDVAAAVHRELPALLSEQRARFVEAGVGGTWLSYKLRPQQPIEETSFSWGPYDSDASA